MLIIRLQRVGRKNDPSFRVVLVDHRQAAKTGKVIEVLGSHDARSDRTELKGEQIKSWISQGAQVSPTVNNLLVKKGVIAGKTLNVSTTKLGKKAKAAVEAKKAAEEKAVKEAAKAEAEKPVEEVKEEVVEPVVTEAETELAPNEVPE